MSGELPDLRRIKVMVQPDSEDKAHAEVGLQAEAWRDLDAGLCTPLAYWQAMIDVAGTLGRVGVALAPFLTLSARKHRCTYALDPDSNGVEDPPLLVGCHMGYSLELLRPSNDFGSSPALWLYVPAGEVKAWVARVAEALDSIANDANDLATFDPLEYENELARATVAGTGHEETSSRLDDLATIPPPVSPGPHLTDDEAAS